jgi:hypothetical protein
VEGEGEGLSDEDVLAEGFGEDLGGGRGRERIREGERGG